MGKKALIFGVTGQDGSYLADLLMEKGYEIHGIIRRSSTFNTGRIEHLVSHPRAIFHHGDLSDGSNLARLIRKIEPEEIYNLGAQSHVRVSFDVPEYTGDVTGLGALRVLDAVRDSGVPAKVYQASSSEMFGSSPPPQSETTPFKPRSPYACAKLYAYWMACNYRENYKMFVCNGILFNHESERRSETFVTRKITMGLAKVKLGLIDKIYLGNLDAKRDWGHAPEYVEGMWRMMQHPVPDDYVLATGETHTVRAFIAEVADYLGIEIGFGGVPCAGVDYKTGKTIIEVDPKFFRPGEVESLCGDYSKAKRLLGWEPKVKFKELARNMAHHDLKLLQEKR